MTATTAFLLHPASALHDTGWGHPEHQGRLRALASAVGKDMLALHGKVVQEEAPEAGVDDLLRVHAAEHVERVREGVDRAAAGRTIIALDADTRVSAASWEAATGSAGAVIRAADLVTSGRYQNAFVVARPPGHHATPERAMGFCLFNNVAVGARWLLFHGHAERVLIVDWDVHHGNGTQDVFYRDGAVFYVSLHQSPHYPGTGSVAERGDGAGKGTTLNVPLPPGTSRAEYARAFDEALGRALSAFTPDFVFVSAGFDVMAGDPLGGQLLEPEDLHRMTCHVMRIAAAACGGRVVVTLEGGYDPVRTGEGAVAVVRALAGAQAPALPGV